MRFHPRDRWTGALSCRSVLRIVNRLSFIFLLVALLPLGAEEPVDRAPVEPKTLPAPDQAVEPVEASLVKLDDGRMRLGKVEFDPATREIQFPAQVNMTEGLLEFLLVHENGKIHESLLSTTISATNLNVVLKLLHYQSSPELYLKIKEDGSASSEFQAATAEQKAGSRLRILISKESAKRSDAVPVNEWIAHAPTEKPMPPEPWIYGGSSIHQGRFLAESSGDIFAIFLSNSAVANFGGTDNQNDEVWLPHATRVPEVGTPVTVIIQPYES